MFTPGLVSITFRQLSPKEVVDLVAQAGLQGIEWGGDIHAPHGDLAKAKEVAALTREAGLQVSAYGSYYRTTASLEEGDTFENVLASAVELGAPSIRIWAGKGGSADMSEEQRSAVTADVHRVAGLAEAEGKIVTLEYHGGTLTDTPESAARLMQEAAHPALRTLWQPPNGMPTDDCMASLELALPLLDNVHVFHWWPTTRERHPLRQGWDGRWGRFLHRLQEDGTPRCLLMEFVAENEPANFLRDAETLKEWIAELEESSAS